MTSISSSRNNNNNSTTYYIGFDVDHTLIKYKNDALGELIFHACARFLWEEKGYDRANLDVPYEKKYGNNRRGLIWDLRTGDIVELSKLGFVKDAYCGTKQLTKEEIQAKYNNNNNTTHFSFDLIRSHTSGDYFTLFDFFVNSTAYLIMLLVDNNMCNNGNYKATLTDLFAAFDFNFAVPHFAISKGYYFPPIVKTPEKYIVDRRADKTDEYLKELQKNPNVKLFLLTNSNYDYATFLLKYAFGDDFLDHFALVIYNGQKKRGFFTAKSSDEKPFLAYNPPANTNLKSEEPLNMSLKNYGGKEVIDGNLIDLNEYFGVSNSDNSSNIQVIYMGDDWKGDVILPRIYKWFTVAIAEELGDERKDEFIYGCTNFDMEETFFYSMLSEGGDILCSDVKEGTLSKIVS